VMADGRWPMANGGIPAGCRQRTAVY
jgi:hypothetical protein